MSENYALPIDLKINDCLQSSVTYRMGLYKIKLYNIKLWGNLVSLSGLGEQGTSTLLKKTR